MLLSVVFCGKLDVCVVLQLFGYILLVNGNRLLAELVFFVVGLHRAALALVVELPSHGIRGCYQRSPHYE